jgi:hypothetical protein
MPQQRYGFDLQKADAFRAQQNAARQQTLQREAAAIRQRQEALGQMKDSQPSVSEQHLAVEIAASAFMAKAEVIQGTRKGVRVNIITQTGRAARTMLNQDTRQLVDVGEGFIYGVRGAEGETFEGKLFPAGHFIYRTVNGSERTIRAYATTAEEAAKYEGAGKAVLSGTSISRTTAQPKLPGKLRRGTMLER